MRFFLTTLWNPSLNLLSATKALTAQALSDVCAEAGVPEPFSISNPPPEELRIDPAAHVPLFLLATRRFASSAPSLEVGAVTAGAASDSGGEAASPRFAGHHADIFSAMDRARRERWSLQQFAKWLQAQLDGDSKREFLWGVFQSVIDGEVLSGRRKIPRPRLSLAETKAASRYHGDRTTISRWIHRYESLATDLGATTAIRPPDKEDAALVERMSRGFLREELFQQASRHSGNKALHLFELLNREGLYADALIAANLLLGIHDGERLPTSEVGTGEYQQRSLGHIEQRFERLAAKYGFAVKDRAALSVVKSVNVQWGKECQRIFRTAQQGGWTMTRFLLTLRMNPRLKKWMGPQAEIGWDIVDRAIRYVVDKETGTPYSIHRDAFAHRGIPRVIFYDWWQKSMSWIERLGR